MTLEVRYREQRNVMKSHHTTLPVAMMGKDEWWALSVICLGDTLMMSRTTKQDPACTSKRTSK